MKLFKSVNLIDELPKAFSDEDSKKFIREIIDPDAILKKIYQFAFIPSTIPSSSEYPIHLKIKENETLTPKNWNHFLQKYYRTEGQNKVCFKFLKFRLEILVSFIKYFQVFSDFNISSETVLKRIAYYRRTDYGDSTGVKKISIDIGKYWPLFWLRYDYLIDQEKIIRQECHFNWLLRCPSPEEIGKEFLEWEIHAIEMFDSLRGFKDYENITFGADSKEDYRIHLCYRGKAIKARNKYLNFSLAKKYKPLLNSKLHDAIKKGLIRWSSYYESYQKDRDAFKLLLLDEFKSKISEWNQNRIVEFPAQYFKIGLKTFITRLFKDKSHSTTEGVHYCNTQRTDDWYFCRYKDPKDDIESPECKYRSGNLCKKSEAKRKRIDEIYFQMDQILPDGSITKIKKTIHGEKKENFYLDALKWENKGAVEDSGVIENIISRVASDSKDTEILSFLIGFDEVINYSKIGRAVGFSGNTVKRRIEKIKRKIKDNFPELLDELDIKFR